MSPALLVGKCIVQEALEEDTGCVRRNPGTVLLEISRMQSSSLGRDGMNLHKEPRAFWERMNWGANTLGSPHLPSEI